MLVICWCQWLVTMWSSGYYLGIGALCKKNCRGQTEGSSTPATLAVVLGELVEKRKMRSQIILPNLNISSFIFHFIFVLLRGPGLSFTNVNSLGENHFRPMIILLFWAMYSSVIPFPSWEKWSSVKFPGSPWNRLSLSSQVPLLH